MKLLYSQASPFARKVLVVAHEHGIADRIELVPVMLTPVAPSAAVNAANPVGKIPTLVLEDGTALFDSRVIAEYLDWTAGQRLFPANGPARWAALRLAAAADGMLDALILTRYERFIRPVEKQFDDWAAGQLAKAWRTLDALEAEADGFAAVGIGEIGVGCALGYLDFRYGAIDWRGSHPRLAKFYEGFAARPSMQATQPPPA
jgi:glutathione S-transferase